MKLRVHLLFTATIILILCLASCGAGGREPADMSSEITTEETPETTAEPAKIIKVVCVGDSITYGTGAKNPLQNSYPARLQKLLGDGYEVVNCGRPSAYVMSPDSPLNEKVKTHGAELCYKNTDEYKKAIISEPDVVIISLGTNDFKGVLKKGGGEQWIADYKALVADFASLESKPKIYLSTTMLIVNSETWYQASDILLYDLTKQVAEELQLPFLDASHALSHYYMSALPLGDKVHPTDDTYDGLACYFYNEIFGGSAAIPEIPQAENGVVFVSGSGKPDNKGSSPDDAINTLQYAFGMLREGGTVVLCGDTPITFTELPETNGTVTVTNVYGGVDYSKTAGAKLTVKSAIVINGDVIFENMKFHAAVSACGIYCNYHNVTFGDGIECTKGDGIAVSIGINAGSTPQSAIIDSRHYDCGENCTLTVNSGRWSVIRGGNRRGNNEYPIGAIAEGAKLSVIINGGEFDFVGSSANTGSGMNDICGELYFEINGGKFAGDVFLVCGVGTNKSGYTPKFSGSATMKISGGEFGGKIGAYQSSSAKKLDGGAKLILAESASALAAKASGFDK